MESGNKVTNTSNPVSRRTCALQNEINCLRAELEAARKQSEAESIAYSAMSAELDRVRGLIDEARNTLRGIAAVTPKSWELPRSEFIDEFLPWAQSRARDAVEKMNAAPVPAQPATTASLDPRHDDALTRAANAMTGLAGGGGDNAKELECAAALRELRDKLTAQPVFNVPRNSFGASFPLVTQQSAVPAQAAAVPAEVARAVQILRKHNEWRRGADNNHWQATPYSPAELGRAIDTVCDATHDIQHDVLKRATQYAHDLVTWLHRDHYADNTTFEPFDDLLGLLSQIDNMICGWKPSAEQSLATITNSHQPAVPDDVAKDASRLALVWRVATGRETDEERATLGNVSPNAEYDEFVAGIDAAILSAADNEGRNDE